MDLLSVVTSHTLAAFPARSQAECYSPYLGAVFFDGAGHTRQRTGATQGKTRQGLASREARGRRSFTVCQSTQQKVWE